MPRDYLVRADGEWVRDSLGRLVSFTAKGAHRWADRHQPASYTVAFLQREGRTPQPGFATPRRGGDESPAGATATATAPSAPNHTDGSR